MPNKKSQAFIAIGSVVALLLGFSLGLLLNFQIFAWKEAMLNISALLGRTWIFVLFAMSVPLVMTMVVSSLLSFSNSKELGKKGGLAVIWYVGIYTLGVIFSLAGTFFFIEMLQNSIPLLTEVSELVHSEEFAAGQDKRSISYAIGLVDGWVRILGTTFIYLFIATLLFTFLSFRFSQSAKNKIESWAKKGADKTFWLFDYFLLTIPFGVFFLILSLVAKTGFQSITVSVYWIVLVVTLLILYTLVLHILVFLKGSVSLRTFVEGMIPTNIIAMTSRSSVACMSALLEAAEKRLSLPRPVASIMVPLFVSVFRLNICISSPAAVVFLAYVFAVELSFSSLFFICASGLLISFGSPGIPSGSKDSTVPLQLAIGIPMEGILLLRMIDAIPDILKTNLNVTNNMLLVTLVTRKEELNLVR